MAWPDFHRGWKSRSTNRWQHRLQREHPTCTERTKNRSSKSADGRVATVATRAGEKPCLTKKERIHLTPTGLLMEGLSTSLRLPFAFSRDDERNGGCFKN